MAKTAFKSVDEYIATYPDDVQAILQRVRDAIRQALPGAEELISYQIPAYKLQGGVILYFAGWKRHYSLYPATDGVVDEFKDELMPYEVNDKGTIRFPLSQPVPEKLIGRIARFRAQETAERPTTKRMPPRKHQARFPTPDPRGAATSRVRSSTTGGAVLRRGMCARKS